MAQWTTPFRLQDRVLDAKLRRLAQTSATVSILDDGSIKDPRSGAVVVQRRGRIRWRTTEMDLHETITAWSLQISVRPVQPAAYAALLALALTNGNPTAVYRDTYPDGREDLTAWWVRPQVANGALQVRHLLEHSARGYTWAALDVEEVVANARAAL